MRIVENIAAVFAALLALALGAGFLLFLIFLWKATLMILAMVCVVFAFIFGLDVLEVRYRERWGRPRGGQGQRRRSP